MNKKRIAIITIFLICFLIYIFTYSPDHTYVNSSSPDALNNIIYPEDIRNSTDRAIYINSIL